MSDESNGNYRIILKKDDLTFKVCRIFFGGDGSYYVTWPYHPENKAFLMKATVNYAQDDLWIQRKEMIDSAALDDDQRRLKVSHHPDGFVQFSGQGIISGRDGDNVRGFGIMSWPLAIPVAGPAFGLTIGRIDLFQQTAEDDSDSLVLHYEDLIPTPGDDMLILEGHYFPQLWRRFIQSHSDGRKTLSIPHPSGAILSLRVLLPSERCVVQGFIGLDVFTLRSFDDLRSPTIGISSSTGNTRYNDEGQKLGDGLFCFHPLLPGPELHDGRSLTYHRLEPPNRTDSD